MDFHVLLITGVMIVLDVVFGFAGAIKQKDVQSSKLRDGLWHKAGFVGLIALAYVIQYTAQHAELGFDVPSVMAVCVYVIVTEIVSVFENLCVLNPNLVDSPLGAIFRKTPKVEAAELASGKEVAGVALSDEGSGSSSESASNEKWVGAEFADVAGGDSK
ncbi:MAG: phage holin family protein [Eggerthellaceae bacterium]|nr:phage holin family protein [Eggerthellaceae bacterium]